jgi:hypothetical protein
MKKRVIFKKNEDKDWCTSMIMSPITSWDLSLEKQANTNNLGASITQILDRAIGASMINFSRQGSS